MIPQSFDYSAPTELSEALDLIANGGKPLSGGMSLIPVMKLRLAAPDHLVDLGRIQALNYIREDGGRIRIGAMATHFQIDSSPLVRNRCPLLAQAAAHIGDVQVRNMGTLGGSIAHADPAADYPAALIALGAQVKLASSSGERSLAITDFLVDTFTTALEPGELVVEVSVPVEDSAAGVSYRKMAHPASGFAIVGVAARVRKTDGRISMIRVGVTGVAPSAYRAGEVEKLLENTSGTEAEIRNAAGAVANGVEANSDIHASAEYRKQMARVYTVRALTAAIAGAA